MADKYCSSVFQEGSPTVFECHSFYFHSSCPCFCLSFSPVYSVLSFFLHTIYSRVLSSRNFLHCLKYSISVQYCNHKPHAAIEF